MRPNDYNCTWCSVGVLVSFNGNFPVNCCWSDITFPWSSADQVFLKLSRRDWIFCIDSWSKARKLLTMLDAGLSASSWMVSNKPDPFKLFKRTLSWTFNNLVASSFLSFSSKSQNAGSSPSKRCSNCSCMASKRTHAPVSVCVRG